MVESQRQLTSTAKPTAAAAVAEAEKQILAQQPPPPVTTVDEVATKKKKKNKSKKKSAKQGPSFDPTAAEFVPNFTFSADPVSEPILDKASKK